MPPLPPVRLGLVVRLFRLPGYDAHLFLQQLRSAWAGCHDWRPRTALVRLSNIKMTLQPNAKALPQDSPGPEERQLALHLGHSWLERYR